LPRKIELQGRFTPRKENEMSDRISALYRDTRNNSALRSLIIMESKLSLPIPFWSGTQDYLRFLFHDVGRQKDKANRLPIYRPYARISTKYEDGRLVEFVLLDFETGKPVNRQEVIGYAPHKEMAGLDFKSAMAKRKELYQYTEDIIPLYRHEKLSSDQMKTVRNYWSSFMQVSETYLRPAYQKLSPDFFKWLGSILK